MNRSLRILTRGWLGNAISVLTFGYYPSTAAVIVTPTPVQRTYVVMAEMRILAIEPEDRTLLVGAA